MAFDVGDLDVSRAAALIASACRKDDLGMAHQADEAHGTGRCALLTFSVVQCFADLLGEQFYTEAVAQRFSAIAAQHRSEHERKLEQYLAEHGDNNEGNE